MDSIITMIIIVIIITTTSRTTMIMKITMDVISYWMFWAVSPRLQPRACGRNLEC